VALLAAHPPGVLLHLADLLQGGRADLEDHVLPQGRTVVGNTRASLLVLLILWAAGSRRASMACGWGTSKWSVWVWGAGCLEGDAKAEALGQAGKVLLYCCMARQQSCCTATRAELALVPVSVLPTGAPSVHLLPGMSDSSAAVGAGQGMTCWVVPSNRTNTGWLLMAAPSGGKPLTVNSDRSPAPASTTTSLKPCFSSVLTTVGVMATRRSPSKISLGTPAWAQHRQSGLGACLRKGQLCPGGWKLWWFAYQR
jgi:hypothetical protein